MDDTTIGNTGIGDTTRPRDGRHRPIAGRDADADAGNPGHTDDPMAGDQSGDHRGDDSPPTGQQRVGDGSIASPADDSPHNGHASAADDSIGSPADDSTEADSRNTNGRHRGGQPGNRNAEKTGHRTVEAERFGLSSPRMPEGYSHIHHNLDQLRRALESEVRRRDGHIDIWRASVISQAIDNERGRQYLLARLRKVEDVPLETSLEVMRTVERCTRERNACISRLKLGDAAEDEQTAYLQSLIGGQTE